MNAVAFHVRRPILTLLALSFTQTVPDASAQDHDAFGSGTQQAEFIKDLETLENKFVELAGLRRDVDLVELAVAVDHAMHREAIDQFVAQQATFDGGW